MVHRAPVRPESRKTIVGRFIATFRDFPPRQKPGSFSVGEALEMLTKPESSD